MTPFQKLMKTHEYHWSMAQGGYVLVPRTKPYNPPRYTWSNELGAWIMSGGEA